MTLDEKLTELESRYVLATLSAAVDVPTTPVRVLVNGLVGEMTYGQTRVLHLRDQYGQRGGLVLHMTDRGTISWRCQGPIEQALAKLR